MVLNDISLNDYEGGSKYPTNDKKRTELTITEAAINVLSDAIPSMMGLLFIFVAETINIIFIGRFNKPELIDGIGVGTFYINATGYVIGTGLLGGVDTLCSQAFGDGMHKMVGIYTNVARICICLYFFLIGLPLVIFTKPILILIGQDEVVAQLSADYCYAILPALFFGLLFNTTLRYLQAMNVFKPGMVVTFITLLFHPIWCYFLVFYYEYDLVGSGVALSITEFLNWVILEIYVYYWNPYPDSYFFISKEIFERVFFTEYLKLALPATVLFAADWVGFEILILMSSYLNDVSLAANVCFLDIVTLIYVIYSGISFATSTLVGNSIGANNIRLAKLYTFVSLAINTITLSVITLLIFIFRDSIPHIYTFDPNTVELVVGLLNIYVCFCVIDSIQVVLHGVIKGLGKQAIASVVALVVFYPINMPLAYMLAFVWGYGVLGLWYSQMVSIILLFVGYTFIVVFSDWEQIARETRVRLEGENMFLNREMKEM
jgi:MATE family multidrug resistance protein